MTFLKYLLTAVEVITSILLIIVVLLQQSKSQGAGMAFGAGVGESLFGAQVSNVLTKVTVVLAVIFLLNTTGLALLSSSASKRAGSVMDDVPIQQPVAAPMAPQGMPQGQAAPPTPVDAGVAMPVDLAPIEINSNTDGSETDAKTAE